MTSSDDTTKVAISIVLEAGTCSLTRKHDLLRCVQVAEERARETGLPFEIILVTESTSDQLPVFGNVRIIPGVCGYYRQKSVGARYSRGAVVAFWDSDCEPTPGYLTTALERLHTEPHIGGVAGVTTYDGRSWLTELNTLLCFGYLSDPQFYPGRLPALAHNVVIRKDRIPCDAFGPFIARYGGDRFLTDAISAERGLLPVDQRLHVKHEDISFSLRLTLERHLREHFGTKHAELLSVSELGLHALDAALRSAARRLARFERATTSSMGTRFRCDNRLARLLAYTLIQAYRILDVAAVATLIIVRPWLRRWLTYQYGPRLHD
jgi:Predicted glycosyltransferases